MRERRNCYTAAAVPVVHWFTLRRTRVVSYAQQQYVCSSATRKNGFVMVCILTHKRYQGMVYLEPINVMIYLAHKDHGVFGWCLLPVSTSHNCCPTAGVSLVTLPSATDRTQIERLDTALVIRVGNACVRHQGVHPYRGCSVCYALCSRSRSNRLKISRSPCDSRY